MEKTDKILAILPHSIGGRLTTSSIIDGFAALGFKIEVFDEIYDKNFLKFFTSKNFSYLLGYDYSAINLKVENNLKIKTINYFSDVLYDPHSGQNWEKLYKYLKDPENISFYWDEKLTKKENNPQIHYLPHFVNTDIYKNLELKSEYDVMFMGRLDNDLRLKTMIKIIKKFGNTAYFGIEKHYRDALSRLDEADRALITKAYKGFIDNEKEMAEAINKTRIVINFNEQGAGSLNYRTIQTYACEKLLLSDFREEGVKYFGKNYIYYNEMSERNKNGVLVSGANEIQGGNALCYENTDDLIKKIDYYLQNEQIAQEIAKKIRKIIEQQFSHRAGVKKMLERMAQAKF